MVLLWLNIIFFHARVWVMWYGHFFNKDGVSSDYVQDYEVIMFFNHSCIHCIYLVFPTLKYDLSFHLQTFLKLWTLCSLHTYNQVIEAPFYNHMRIGCTYSCYVYICTSDLWFFMHVLWSMHTLELLQVRTIWVINVPKYFTTLNLPTFPQFVLGLIFHVIGL